MSDAVFAMGDPEANAIINELHNTIREIEACTPQRLQSEFYFLTIEQSSSSNDPMVPVTRNPFALKALKAKDLISSLERNKYLPYDKSRPGTKRKHEDDPEGLQRLRDVKNEAREFTRDFQGVHEFSETGVTKQQLALPPSSPTTYAPEPTHAPTPNHKHV